MQFDEEYASEYSERKNEENPAPLQRQNTNAYGAKCLISIFVAVIILGGLVGVGLYLNNQKNQKLRQPVLNSNADYEEYVETNLIQLKITALEPKEFLNDIRFSAYVKNQRGQSIGNVYFTLILYDNVNIVYQTWTSYLLGADYYCIVSIDIPQTKIPYYSSYKWEMSSTKPSF